MIRRWVGALSPLAVGAGIGLLAWFGIITNPLLYLRGDLGTLAVLTGGLISGIFALGLHRRESYRREVTQIEASAAAERRRFLQRLDHELKNPLTAIRAGLANLDANSPHVRQTAIAGIENDVLHVSRLVTDLRKLVELEARPLEAARIDVAALLQDVVAVVQEPDCPARQLALTLPKAPWPVPSIAGDPDLLFLAVYNVVQNALKFTEPNETIEIRALEDGASVIIEVANTGPGIPAQDLPHIWEELYRGSNAQDMPGSGLGLALVRAVVERHGGQVHVRSRLEQGTLISLRLPISSS